MKSLSVFINKMKSAQLRVSAEQKRLFKEIRALKKLPKTTENKALIDEKTRQFRSPAILRGSASIDTGEGIVFLESFVGSFADGKKAVAVYYRDEDEFYWNPRALFTWMTDAEAQTYFGVENMNVVTAENGEFYEAEWQENDNSDNWPLGLDPLENEQILKDLGLVGAKGYFQGGDNVYVSPKDIVRGKVAIVLWDGPVDDGDANAVGVITTVSFTDWTWWIVIIIVVLLLLAYMYKRY